MMHHAKRTRAFVVGLLLSVVSNVRFDVRAVAEPLPQCLLECRQRVARCVRGAGTFLARQGYVRWKRRAARALPPRRKGRRRTREEAVHWPLPDRLYEVLPGGGRRYGV